MNAYPDRILYIISHLLCSMEITVVIPTLNSEETIGMAVRSAMEHADEVIVVDSFSTDRTVEIVRKEGAKVVRVIGSRLKARIEGAKLAKGYYIVNLDSDMYFSNNFSGFKEKVITLGEITVGKGIVSKMLGIDRRLTQKAYKNNLSPIEGGIIPRMYERELLLKAYESIQQALGSDVAVQYLEDSIIYYNVMKKYEGRVQFIPDAVYHLENDTLFSFMKKWYKYGRSSKLLRGTEYERLIHARRTRPGLSFFEKLELLPLTLIKGIPFALGYYLP